MGIDNANNIEKSYGPIDFPDPIISFGYNEIQFESKLTFVEKSYAIMGLFFVFIPILILRSPGLTIIFGAIHMYYIYELIISLDVVKIDFLNKEIQISNPNFLVNSFRKILKRPIEISFHKIHSFKNYTRKSTWMKNRPNILVAKSPDHSPIKIAKFRFEKDSRTMAELCGTGMGRAGCGSGPSDARRFAPRRRAPAGLF